MRTINRLLFFSIISFFVSCNSDSYEEHEIGDNLIDQTTEVVLIDTFSIESSTIILDSLITSGSRTAILGSYKDEYLGDIKAEYYGLLSLNGSFQRSSIDGSVEKVPIQFDSLVFIAYPDGRYFGDTLQAQRIIINRVAEDMELPDNEFAFYGHNSFEYDDLPLLDREFYLNPIKQSRYDEAIDLHAQSGAVSYYGKYFGEGIYLKLDNEQALALGEDIVEKVNAESDSVTESIQWRKFMKGIVIRPGDENSTLFHVPLADNKLKLRLYYSDTDYSDKGRVKFHDFPVVSSLGNQNYSFLNYSADRSNTPQQLDRLVEQEVELDSELTDDLTFIQGGLGMYTKIKIPHIENLITLGLTGGVIRADLLLYPTDNSYDDEVFPLPMSSLNLYNTNENNVIGSQLAGGQSAGLSFTFVPNFNNEDESVYVADLTSYVNSILVNGKEYDDALLIGFPFENIGYTYDRLIVENDLASDFRIRLRVTYVIQR
ncbi:DUF4270 family protein [Marinifilum sp.]|uniref:DUF4270 family protein n=1 Tax=Marinifilum sp. TaxID=2033137 RepID=UPI003BA957F4